MIVWCRNLTILLLGLAFHCFLLQKIENRYATALAGHRAAILFNYYYKVTYTDKNGEVKEGYVAKRNLKIIEEQEKIV